MDINQLRCFITVGEELHFGRAAQRMEMMPASLSRFIRLLEEDLGVRLLNRSTRNVALTQEGVEFFDEAVKLVAQFDALAWRFRTANKRGRKALRIGAIDSAARGLIPHLLNYFMQLYPDADIHLTEDKTINLIPRLKSGWLDIIFIRPPENLDSRLACRLIARETCVLAVPVNHPLASKSCVSVTDFAEESMILPERRTRPHSHDLTMNIFKSAGLTPHIAQFAEEKQTILSFVSAGLGLAIVPTSFRNINSEGVTCIALETDEKVKKLPLSVAWLKGRDDASIAALLQILADNRTTLITPL